VTNSTAAEVLINHVSAETLKWLIRTSDAVLLVAEGVIRPVFGVSALTWFIRTSAAVLLVAEGVIWANDTLGD
jgi:sulfur transfer complex TusBCD TusB component (DsrH family)